MKIVVATISITELSEMAEKIPEKLVKVVVDRERGVMAVDLEMHADGEWLLMNNGFQLKNVWGITLHPDAFGSEEFIVFDSMINFRPGEGNRSRGVDNSAVQEQIRKVVHKLVTS